MEYPVPAHHHEGVAVLASARKALLVVVEVASGLVFGLLIAVLAVWLLFDWESSSEEVFLVPDAALTLAAAHEALAAGAGGEALPDGFLLEGHHLSPGKGLAVALRRETGRPFALTLTDQAKFEYLTLWLPPGAADAAGRYDLAAAGGYGFYSAATYGFSRSGGCFGVARDGTVTIEGDGPLRPGGAVTVRLELTIRTRQLGAVDTENCGRVDFAGEYRAETVTLPRFDQRPMAPRGEEEVAE